MTKPKPKPKPKPKTRPRGRPPKPEIVKKSAAINVRTETGLRVALEASAEQNRRSLSAEIAARLAASLNEERAFGGPELHAIALLMSGRFRFNGQQAAELKFGPDAKPADWMKDSLCFDNALLAVVEALWARRPDNAKEATVLWFERLKGRIMTRYMNEEAKR